VKRTMLNLRGKDPITAHMNTIMDYTFYWFIGIYDYYRYTGDASFIRQIYPRMQSLMNYCLSRRNARGMIEGLDGDWVFIDWADFEMSKAGEVSFEQLLFCRSLETMALCAGLLNQEEDRAQYAQLAQNLSDQLFTSFWSKEQQAFIHNRERGIASRQVTPFTNIFAVLFDYLDAEKTAAVKRNVLLNPDALKITTPYMRFYELEALCLLGEHSHVLQEIRDYWGGMLDLGATSFWEKYNPSETGVEHFAMYGRPYGKSLCHAWGASPLYLFGKHYLGVEPETAGYETFRIRPHLADLQWMEGVVPTPNGEIKVYVDKKQIKVSASAGEGYLYFSSATKPRSRSGNVEPLGNNEYRIKIEADKEYLINHITAFDTRVSDFDTRVSDFDTRVSDFDTHVSNFDTHVSDFDTHVSDFDTRVSNFVNRLTDFVNRQTDFVNRQTNFVNRQTDFVNRQTDFVNRQTDFVNHRTDFVCHRTDFVCHRTDFVCRLTESATDIQTLKTFVYI
jgi:hypothetical protein